LIGNIELIEKFADWLIHSVQSVSGAQSFTIYFSPSLSPFHLFPPSPTLPLLSLSTVSLGWPKFFFLSSNKEGTGDHRDRYFTSYNYLYKGYSARNIEIVAK
jgi:hypothetical protein